MTTDTTTTTVLVEDIDGEPLLWLETDADGNTTLNDYNNAVPFDPAEEHIGDAVERWMRAVGMQRWLFTVTWRRVSDGTLAAEAVVAFAGQRLLLRRIAMLPLDEQRRFAAGERVPVWVPSDDGTGGATRYLPLSVLTAQQVAIVFDEDGRIRTPIEQRQIQLRTVARRTYDSIVLSPTKRAEIQAALAVLSDDDLRLMAMERGYALAPKCSIDGCLRPVQARTLCWQHYRRQRRADKGVAK